MGTSVYVKYDNNKNKKHWKGFAQFGCLTLQIKVKFIFWNFSYSLIYNDIKDFIPKHILCHRLVLWICHT